MGRRKRSSSGRPHKRVAIMMELFSPYRRHVDVLIGTQNYAAKQGHWECVLDEFVPFTLAHCSTSPYDGVIARTTRALDREARRCGIPVVNVWYNSPVRSRPGVFVGLEVCGQMAAEHLLQRGFRNFACLSGFKDRAQRIEIEAFHETIGKAGFSCQCAMVPRQYDESARAFQQFNLTATKWVAEWKTPIGVYITFPDITGRIIVEMAKRRGCAIPEQVAIVISDSDPILCLLPPPSLSGLDIPYASMGYQAAEMLDQLMAGKTPNEPRKFIEPTGIILRQSTDFLAVDDPLVASALRCIAGKAHQSIGVEDVCRDVLAGRRTLERRFREVLGRSVGDEIRRLRMERAKRELAHGDTPIKQIARNAGFSDAKRLQEAFRRTLGESPTHYRNRMHLSRS